MRRFAVVCALALSLGGCFGLRAPLNPPRLVSTAETDLSIQLFMQATILLSNFYGYETIRYSEIRARSARSGFPVLPFMPPESVRATPELVNFENIYENNPARLADLLQKYGGYKILVKYYIRTGLRASQSICRNYLLGLEERNQYLEFLQREFGVAATLASGILLLVNANNTLTQSFLLGTTAANSAIDAYQEFRFLNVDREAALTLVETAQNKLAEHFFKLVDAGTPDSNIAAGGYTFSDALHAVSLIEHQCTRTGIRHLLTRSIANSPSNLVVDQLTGTFLFNSSKNRTIDGGERVRSVRPIIPNAPAPLSPVSRPPRPPVVMITPGVVTPPVVVAPPVVTPPVVTPPVVTPPVTLTSAERIRPFFQASEANQERVQSWLRGRGIAGSVTNFLVQPAQETNRQQMIRDLGIP